MSYWLRWYHIAGSQNNVADLLSRWNNTRLCGGMENALLLFLIYFINFVY